MNTALIIAQTAVSVILIALILIQQRGTGMSDAVAGRVSSFATRRGAEKAVFMATVLFGLLFAVIPVIRIVVQ